MKLPEGKKERTQMLVLIGIGVVAAIGLIFKAPVVGILPVLKSKKEKLAKIEQLKIEIESANKEIRQLDRDKAENLEILRKIAEVSEKCVLKPVLGNYKISALEVIEPIAKKYNLKTEQLRQIGISQEAGQASLRAFGTRVTLFCSYDEARHFVSEIEQNNPLLSVLNISINGRGGENREKHSVSFDVQWPVWTDMEIPVKLAQQLKELDKTPESAPK